MPRKAQTLSPQEILNSITKGMRQASQRPSVVGYKPMNHQGPFHSSTARGKAFIAGNRSGKTVAGATEAVMWLTGNHPYRPTPRPPVHGRGIAVDFDHGVELIMKPEIARWMPQSELINGSWEKSYSKSLRQLTLQNGSTLEFLSTDQDLDKHAGTSRHFVWFDEEPPKEYFTENLVRLIDVGGSWWITMTPVEGMTWTFDDIYNAAQLDNNIDVFTASMDQNIYINTSEIDMYLAGLTKEEKDARRHGKFVQLGGLIYAKHFNAERNIIPTIINSERWESFRSDGKWAHFLAMDHGFNNPTAWLFMAADTDGRIIVYDEYYKDREIVKYHAREIRERITLLGINPSYLVGDPTIRNTDPITGTSVQLEYQEAGVSIAPGNNDVRAGINRVARLFEDGRLVLTRNCSKTLWELNRYRWAKWATKRVEADHNVKEEPLKKDDHLMDALRYGVASRFSQEEDIVPGLTNVLQVREAVLAGGTAIDYELLKSAYDPSNQSTHDVILGTEW